MSRKPQKSFESIVREAHGFLSADGLQLRLFGYKEAMSDYFSIHDHDIVEIHKNLLNCNLWADYFSEIIAVLLTYQEHYQLTADWYRAVEDLNNPSAHLEALYQEELRKFNLTKQLVKQCRAQKRFFEKATNHCLHLYKKSTKDFCSYDD